MKIAIRQFLLLIAFQAAFISTEFTSSGETLSEEAWARLSGEIGKLPVIGFPLQKAKTDWLIDPSSYKAGVYATADGKSVVISNGLTARVFRITPNLATTDIINQMTGETMLRAVSSEGEVVINGEKWSLGGLTGQPDRGFIKPEWIDRMTAVPNSFTVDGFEIEDSVSVLDWARSRWALNKKNPTGKSIVFTLKGTESTKDIIVRLRFDIYDGVPVIRKSMEVFNNSDQTVTLDSFTLERLYFEEPESTDGNMSERYMPNIHIESDYCFGGSFWEYTGDRVEHWVTNPEYTSQCNYGLNTLCTLEARMDIGPDERISDTATFKSYDVYEMPFDTYERERKGLFLRRFYTKLTPWVTENPIFMHLTTIDEQTVKRAVDQCAETGYEMIILSFGSGMDAETTDPGHIAYIKSLASYAKEKGIEMGGYSLLASRWISDEVDVINPRRGKPEERSSAPLLASAANGDKTISPKSRVSTKKPDSLCLNTTARTQAMSALRPHTRSTRVWRIHNGNSSSSSRTCTIGVWPKVCL